MKPFGYSYLLDMYGCDHCDSLEVGYRFLEELVEKLGMTKMSAPYVMHAPTLNGQELFPDKAGISAWVPLIESGIQIHTLAPKRFITLDVYSCRPFRQYLVSDLARATFNFTDYEESFITRGNAYDA